MFKNINKDEFKIENNNQIKENTLCQIYHNVINEIECQECPTFKTLCQK